MINMFTPVFIFDWSKGLNFLMKKMSAKVFQGITQHLASGVVVNNMNQFLATN